jgi:hypothetical protein
MAQPDVTEIVMLARNEGNLGVANWLKVKLPAFKDDPASAEALYWLVKKESPAAAFLLTSLFRVSGLNLPKLWADWDLASRENPGLWSTEVAHILSPAILGRVREALESGDVLCGFQFHFGGCSASEVAFSTFSSFETHISSTRPGDFFTLLSVKQLATRNELLEPTPDAVKRWLTLNPSQEVLLLKTELQPPGVENIWNDRAEEEDVNCLFQPAEGLVAVPIPPKPDFFIDAKVPNKKGAIPLGGSY